MSAYEELRSATHAYVGYCVGCGALYAAAVDYPEGKSRVAKFVARLVKDGARVERVTNDHVRQHLANCTCKAPPRKAAPHPDLFASSPSPLAQTSRPDAR